MLFLDPLYLILVSPALVFAIWASWRVRSNFAKYSAVGVRSGMTGAEAAAAVARAGGATVTIEKHQGFLSDHYNPKTKTLHLSPEVYEGRSISSIAVAAHEAGHSIQDAEGYALLGLRSKLVPVCMIGSNLWFWVFFAGIVFHAPMLQNIGILFFGVVVLFQLVTLPVEFDASNRAKAVLASTGIVTNEAEEQGVRKVLGAAAMTYVAGALMAILQLLYLLARRRN
jgi:Zn-dependent membrane protease YugP